MSKNDAKMSEVHYLIVTFWKWTFFLKTCEKIIIVYVENKDFPDDIQSIMLKMKTVGTFFDQAMVISCQVFNRNKCPMGHIAQGGLGVLWFELTWIYTN